MNKSRGFSFSSLFQFIAFLILGYICYVYVPIFLTRTSLSNLVREECYGGKSKTQDQLREQIKLSAANQLLVDLNIEDIAVNRLTDRYRVKVTWYPVADLLYEKIQHTITVDEEVIFY